MSGDELNSKLAQKQKLMSLINPLKASRFHFMKKLSVDNDKYQLAYYSTANVIKNLEEKIKKYVNDPDMKRDDFVNDLKKYLSNEDDKDIRELNKHRDLFSEIITNIINGVLKCFSKDHKDNPSVFFKTNSGKKLSGISTGLDALTDEEPNSSHTMK